MRSARPDPGLLARLCVLMASALIAAIAGSAVFAQTPPPAGVREAAQPTPVLTPGAATPGTPPGIMNPGTPQRNTPARNVPAAIAPTVLKVEPVSVMAGQSYTLNLTGTLFQQSMQLDFGTGIVVQPKTLALIDASHARVAVQVAAGTPAGQRLVTASIVVQTPAAPGAPIKNQGPGYVNVVAGNVTGPLVLERVIPATVQQGQTTTLTLEGSGFNAGMSVSFGPGISASGPVEVQSAEHATLSIRVAAQAPPMLRHPTVLITGRDVKVSPEASLTVTAVSQVVPPVPVPTPVSYASVSVLLAVSPARLFAGQSYTLTLRGLNLVPQLQVDLGDGHHSEGRPARAVAEPRDPRCHGGERCRRRHALARTAAALRPHARPPGRERPGAARGSRLAWLRAEALGMQAAARRAQRDHRARRAALLEQIQ